MKERDKDKTRFLGDNADLANGQGERTGREGLGEKKISSVLIVPSKGMSMKYPIRNAKQTVGDVGLYTGRMFWSRDAECRIHSLYW